MQKIVLPAAVAIVIIAVALAGCSSPEPEANVQGDSTALAGHAIALSGDASSHPDGNPLTYSWQIARAPEGSMAQLVSLDLPSTHLTPDIPGEYEVSLTVSDGRRDSPAKAFVVQAMPWFTEITESAGVPGGGTQNFRNGFGPGASWSDYDGDGDPDLYAASDGPNMLYRSNGDGTFTDVTAEAGVTAPCNSYGVAWADFDNDGDQDLYVVCHSEDQGVSIEHKASEPNLLYLNNGDGTFTDVAPLAGVDHVAHGSGATWVDYDADGLLDLYVANFGIYGEEGEGMGDGNVLYRNNGDGTFTDVSEQAGVRGQHGPVRYRWAGGKLIKTGMTFESIWFDYDNDGDQDFIECNDQGVSPLYRNEANGTFTDVTEARGHVRAWDAAWASTRATTTRTATWTSTGATTTRTSCGTTTATAPSRRSPQMLGVADFMNVGWATGFVDYDNDGYLDIYVTNGLVGVPVEEGGTWRQVTPGAQRPVPQQRRRHLHRRQRRGGLRQPGRGPGHRGGRLRRRRRGRLLRGQRRRRQRPLPQRAGRDRTTG